jgi:sugar phosphate isomerase/epimerase
MHYLCGMKPVIAMCNIFDQDAERLADFAAANGFSGIDWSMDPSLPEKRFQSLMGSLSGFQVRYHCRFHGVEIACADRRGDDSLALLMRTVDQVARAGGGHMTVHSGLGNPTGEGIDLLRAIDNLAVLVAHGKNNGVAVCLENLTTPLTNDPRIFQQIVGESGAYATIDIGHAHAVRDMHPLTDSFVRYVLPHRKRILNAHIYHTEPAGYGHVPPSSLADISSRLDILCLAESCNWWVIELMDPTELLGTRTLLQEYLERRHLRAGPVRHVTPLPFAAV